MAMDPVDRFNKIPPPSATPPVDLVKAMDGFFTNEGPQLVKPTVTSVQSSLKHIFPEIIDSAKLSEQIPQNKTIFQRAQNLFAFFVKFAKTHPFLTAGFAVACVLLIVSFPIFGASFAGITSVTLLGMHIPITGVLGILCLYYGISMINLARRAAIKDELEHQLEIQLEHLKAFQESLSAQQEQQIENQNAALEKKSVEITTSGSKKIREKIAEINDLNKELNSIKASLEQMLTKNLNPEMKEKVNHYLERVTKEIKMGTQLALEYKTFSTTQSNRPVNESKKPSLIISDVKDHPLKNPELLPDITAVESLPIDLKLDTQGALELPPISIGEKTTRQRILSDLKKKFSDLTEGIQQYAKKHPVGTTIIILGAIVALIALPVLFIWLGGFSTIFFLGSLSLIAIMQLLIYGFSLAYEGYNAIAISQLKKSIKESQAKIKEKELEMAKLLTPELREKDKPKKYQDYLKSHTDLIEKQTKAEKKRFKDEAKTKQKLVNECNSFFRQALNDPRLSEIDTTYAFSDPMKGAELVVSKR